MKIKKVIPSGYCKGVVRAIEIAKQARKDNPNDNIYVLGMIVHNRYITEALKLYDITTLDDSIKSKEELIDEIDDGIVIFTAHGISEKIKNKAIQKGLKVIDASCIDVIKTQNIIKKKLSEGFNVLYIGKNRHPEAEAVLAIDKKIQLISNINELDSTEISEPIFVTNQTTMSIFEIQDINNRIKEKWPNATILEEICNATSIRQKAIMDLKDCDLLYVVGDPKSNNTNKLKQIALQSGIKKVLMIENAHDIDIKDLNVDNIYVTAGASTPTYLTNQVIECLNKFNESGSLIKEEIKIDKLIS